MNEDAIIAHLAQVFEKGPSGGLYLRYIIELMDDHEHNCWSCEMDEAAEDSMQWKPPGEGFWYPDWDDFIFEWIHYDQETLPAPAGDFTRGPEYPTPTLCYK
jgi:hypothetical protein